MPLQLKCVEKRRAPAVPVNAGGLPSTAACRTLHGSSLAVSLHKVCVMELTRRSYSCCCFGVQRQLCLPKLLDNCLVKDHPNYWVVSLTGHCYKFPVNIVLPRGRIVILYSPRAKFWPSAKNPLYVSEALCSGDGKWPLPFPLEDERSSSSVAPAARSLLQGLFVEWLCASHQLSSMRLVGNGLTGRLLPC